MGEMHHRRVQCCTALLLLLPTVAVGVIEVVPKPFCSDCRRPDALYTLPNETVYNIVATESLVNRSTPDGVNPWPYKMVDGWPTAPGTECDQDLYPNPCFDYKVVERASWWDSFASQEALPTNTWFTDLFSNPPVVVNPIIFAWPVYTSPYAIFAANDGLSVTLPLYLVAKNGGNPGIAGDIDEDSSDSIAPEITATASERVCVVTARGDPQFANSGRRVTGYDKNALSVEIEYAAAGGTIDFLLSRGSPYVTAIFTGLDPVLNFATTVVDTINGVMCSNGCSNVQGTALASGVKKYVLQIHGADEPWYTYIVYSSAELGLSVGKAAVGTGWDVEATEGACSGGCAVRIAVSQVQRHPDIEGVTEFSLRWTSIPPEGKTLVSEAALDDGANTYPKLTDDKTVRYYTRSTGIQMQFHWGTTCMVAGCSPSTLLMLALPHHQSLVSHAGAAYPQVPTPSVQYAVTSGIAVAYTGNVWELNYDFSSVSPVMSRAMQNHFALLDKDVPAAPATEQSDPFFTSKTVDAKYKDEIVASLRADMAYWTDVHNVEVMRSPAFMFRSSDCYAFGKFAAGIARLVLIADELGEMDTARIGRDFLRCRLNQWLEPAQDGSSYFPYAGANFPGNLRDGVPTYDTTWGGIPTTSGLRNPGPSWVRNGTQPDFGSGGYNDHLFHYGYYLYSVSVVLRGASLSGGAQPGQAGLQFSSSECLWMNDSDATWFSRYSKRILLWARDIGNPDQQHDPYFTQNRHHSDWYAGHSWARGLFPSGLTSSNMESTSEALQAWYAMFLLGSAIDSAGLPGMAYEADALKTAATLSLLTESVSVKHYWHLLPNTTDPFREAVLPASFRGLGVTGNLWSAAVSYQAFFAYGLCQWTGGKAENCPHDLTLQQIHWFNRLFIVQIQMLPYTPMTEGIMEAEWVEAAMYTSRLNYTASDGRVSYGYDPLVIWDDLPSSYTRCNGTTPDLGRRCTQGWMAYALQALACLPGKQETAYNLALTVDGVADGGTVTNLLWWIATR